MENITTGQVGEMIALFAKKLPLTMLKGPAKDLGTAQYWIDNPDRFESVIAEALMPKLATAASPVPLSPLVSLPVLFKTEDTNLEEAIALSEKFSAKVLGNSVDLRKLFNLPAKLPWKNVLLVFDPGYDNRKAVEVAIKGQSLNEWEETDVMKYSESAKSAEPTLHIIENSITPTADTLGDQAKSPNQLNADGRLYIELRGYALAFGQRYFGFKDSLDEFTWTWCPKNRLRGGGVALGGWRPYYRQVWFDWHGSDGVDPSGGARLAIPVQLKT